LEEEEDNTSLIEWNKINKSVLDKLINKSHSNYLRINKKLEYNDEFRINFLNKIISTVNPGQFLLMDYKFKDSSEQSDSASDIDIATTRGQINFLIEYWMNIGEHRFNISDCDPTKLKIYAEALLDKIKESICDKKLAIVEYQLRMLAEVFQNDCNKFCKSEKIKPELDAAGLDLIDLYEMFLSKKYDIYFNEIMKLDSNNTQIKEENIPNMIKKHETELQLIALYTIFNKEDIELLLNDEQVQIIKSFIQKFKKGEIILVLLIK
jgi:hypothetical protein